MPFVWPFQSVTTPNYLSGVFAWTTTPTRPLGLAADTTPIRIKSIWVTSTRDTEETVTISDGSSVGLVRTLAVPAHSGPMRIDGLELEAFNGLLVSSTQNTGIQGQVEGWV